jgi:hypothetical protein
MIIKEFGRRPNSSPGCISLLEFDNAPCCPFAFKLEIIIAEDKTKRSKQAVHVNGINLTHNRFLGSLISLAGIFAIQFTTVPFIITQTKLKFILIKHPG